MKDRNSLYLRNINFKNYLKELKNFDPNQAMNVFCLTDSKQKQKIYCSKEKKENEITKKEQKIKSLLRELQKRKEATVNIDQDKDYLEANQKIRDIRESLMTKEKFIGKISSQKEGQKYGRNIQLNHKNTQLPY